MFYLFRKEGNVGFKLKCGGWDSNPRTPTGGDLSSDDLESPAFGLASLPPPKVSKG